MTKIRHPDKSPEQLQAIAAAAARGVLSAWQFRDRAKKAAREAEDTVRRAEHAANLAWIDYKDAVQKWQPELETCPHPIEAITGLLDSTKIAERINSELPDAPVL